MSLVSENSVALLYFIPQLFALLFCLLCSLSLLQEFLLYHHQPIAQLSNHRVILIYLCLVLLQLAVEIFDFALLQVSLPRHKHLLALAPLVFDVLLAQVEERGGDTCLLEISNILKRRIGHSTENL